jgi:ABC-2 type transport system permease protein
MNTIKQEIIDRFNIVRACTKFTFQKETAYWANNLASLSSTTFYTITMLVFINILYSNVNLIVGYTKNDMLIFFLVGQFTFYANFFFSLKSMDEFIIEVNRGDLDLILTKPIPALFYVTFKRLRLFSTLRDGIPPTLAIILSIDWQQLQFSPKLLIPAIIIFICGLICLHVVEFLTTLPVFWLGESKNILKISLEIYEGTALIPYEGFTHSLKFILSTLIPVLISTGFTSSILLNKSSLYLLLPWGIVVTIVAVFIMNIAWNKALKSYTSASS